MSFGFAPTYGVVADDLQAYLHEHRAEFIRGFADGSFVVLEVELDRLVAEFLRSVNRLH